MKFFLMNKYQTIEENVLVTSKLLYEMLDEEKHIDQLFLEFAKSRNITLNLNIERVLYLSLTFLYSFDLIVLNNNLVMRTKK
ncbi:hypothetical protein PaeCFBP13512_19760 [Paenibacillus sp. CFBP13512]|uniref:hypothetical protein n=1 Tax=Paenibacillus sp. CFBP13512 TaxID=2184007 RepID=UPI0010C039EC|nr:hypothetical protein [Paenibacillus sp. CFBP13512]TKJ86072.1 hypothetical protein PaeCFBP13512_19760 [Paenibacillus sp. CFBP13512]